MQYLPVEEYNFKDIQINTIKTALQEGLTDYFAEVEVNVIECPDLTKKPFNLATKGFGGPINGIMDIGGPPNLIPVVNKTKVYDLASLIPACTGTMDFDNGWYISGCGAGPWPSQGCNSEMVINMKIGKNQKIDKNMSKIAIVRKETLKGRNIDVKSVDLKETRCALLANILVSSGKKGGQVIEIKCKRRIEPDMNFTASIREALEREFGDVPVGLGGVFLIRKSSTNIGVMQNFSKTPLLSNEDVQDWLQDFEMHSPMLFQSVLVSSDPGLELREEHSHGWSLNGKQEAGHYNHDLSPDTVEYHGYFTVAQKLWRVDRPSFSVLQV